MTNQWCPLVRKMLAEGVKGGWEIIMNPVIMQLKIRCATAKRNEQSLY